MIPFQTHPEVMPFTSPSPRIYILTTLIVLLLCAYTLLCPRPLERAEVLPFDDEDEEEDDYDDCLED